jgi:hypothetical protein
MFRSSMRSSSGSYLFIPLSMLLILKTIKLFKKYYQSIVFMWQHMFSMPVMRTVWRRITGILSSKYSNIGFVSSYYIQLTINILIKHYLTLQYAAT